MRSKKLNLNKIEISNLDSAKINEGTNKILGGATAENNCLTSDPDTIKNAYCKSDQFPCLYTKFCEDWAQTEGSKCEIDTETFQDNCI